MIFLWMPKARRKAHSKFCRTPAKLPMIETNPESFCMLVKIVKNLVLFGKTSLDIEHGRLKLELNMDRVWPATSAAHSVQDILCANTLYPAAPWDNETERSSFTSSTRLYDLVGAFVWLPLNIHDWSKMFAIWFCQQYTLMARPGILRSDH